MTFTAEVVAGSPHATGIPTFIGHTCDHRHKTEHTAWMCGAAMAKRYYLPAQRDRDGWTYVHLTIKVLENR